MATGGARLPGSRALLKGRRSPRAVQPHRGPPARVCRRWTRDPRSPTRATTTHQPQRDLPPGITPRLARRLSRLRLSTTRAVGGLSHLRLSSARVTAAALTDATLTDEASRDALRIETITSETQASRSHICDSQGCEPPTMGVEGAPPPSSPRGGRGSGTSQISSTTGARRPQVRTSDGQRAPRSTRAAQARSHGPA